MTPPELRIIPSRLARHGSLVLHLLAASTTLLLPLIWSLPALLFVLAHFIWNRRQPALPCYLQILPDGRVSLIRGDMPTQLAEILPSSLITSWLMVLHLRTEAGRIYLPLWPDSAKRDALRQWRVWLRWSLPALQRKVAESEMADLG